MHPKAPDRRRFLRDTAVLGLAPLTTASTLAAPSTATGAGVRRYARLGRTNLSVSDISFGASRLRAGEEDLVAHALDRGINYFDTAEGYTRGDSETVLGNALRGRRDKVVLVSKHITGANEGAGEMMAALEATLTRLRTDYVDIYMSHAINSVARLENAEWHAFIDRARQQGKLRFSGVSGHAGNLAECLEYALAQDMVDVILAAYNFGQDPKFYEGFTRSFDMVATQPRLPAILSRARAQDVGVVAMKTLMGARLNDMRPFETGGATYAQAAFRWVLANPDVNALIISMTSRARIDEYLGASGATALAAGDLPLLERYAALNGHTYCRQACDACDGACPHGVPIADVLRTRMYATDYQDVAFARAEYAMLGDGAAACLGCSGAPCRGACPHGIDIARFCAPTHRMLS
ncbi:MAG: aldo/keto reductase [Pseudomonadales bacterium]|nr:aldo/keto reductase [Pseudomonadales bacterium]